MRGTWFEYETIRRKVAGNAVASITAKIGTSTRPRRSGPARLPAGLALPGTLDHFLLERYILYAQLGMSRCAYRATSIMRRIPAQSGPAKLSADSTRRQWHSSGIRLPVTPRSAKGSMSRSLDCATYRRKKPPQKWSLPCNPAPLVGKTLRGGPLLIRPSRFFHLRQSFFRLFNHFLVQF